ncbi:unnamed protein product [Macrosiphum euphorbiae]|uniref:Reverse transcriptase domain-containing protein n=1 Tax=Macrosiphum euphorbiae TaxID=13131 RepID=A0AAV0WWA5_9HEMI|nr:unnamed protein product [Macrosiphum euphorbiae]
MGKPSKQMNNINKITNKDGIIVESKTEICNEFNDFFVNVGNNLEIEHINSADIYFNDKNQSNNSIFLNPISSEEISEYIDKIKNFNSYYEHGVFPLAFKKCIVIPLFKSGDKLSCGNYRPISLSLTISNIFEKCIKNRLLNYFKKNSFFSNSQFGFLAGLSTSDALFKLDNFVRRHIDINYKVMGIFLDVQKAFDSVNHELLLKKLEYSGIRGVLII